jgi:hypothetical protein
VSIRTSQGHKVEIIEPLTRTGELFSIRVAVDGRPYPGIRGPFAMWEQELAVTAEDEFWQNVADAALSMGDAMTLLHNQGR